MADVSYDELQERVARKLQILATAESLDANDAEIIIDGLLSVQAQLYALGIAAFVVQGGLDEAYADTFVDMVAAQVADAFEIPEPRRSILVANKLGLPGRSPAERYLRDLMDVDTQKLFVTAPDITVV